MLDVSVQRLEPDRAVEADLAGYHEVMRASQAAQRPDGPALTYEVAVQRLTTPFPGLGPVAWWIAKAGTDVVGVAGVHFPGEPNAHVGLAEVTVHPGLRRRRIGSALLAAVLPELRERGREVVEGLQVTAGGPGERWALALGFRPVRAITTQALTIAEADRSLWPADVPPGYRLRRWTGTAPQDIVEAFAQARDSIQDAPIGESEFRHPAWTVHRIREAEADYERQDIEQRVVVAVHQATGAVAGLTEVIVHPLRPTWCFQGDTVVVPHHRGRGLGRCLKGHLAHWLLADRPQLERIQTNTSTDNTHMLRVNEQLGYRTVATSITMRRELSALATDLPPG